MVKRKIVSGISELQATLKTDTTGLSRRLKTEKK